MRSDSVSTLGEVVRTTGGVLQTGPFGSQLHADDYTESGTPLVMPINIGDNEIREPGITRIGEDDARRLRKHALRQGDIVFGRRGDIGRRAIVRELQEGWICGSGCLAVRFGARLDHVNPAYIAEYVGSRDAQIWLENNAVGGTMANLNTAIVGALPVQVPDREQQDRVVLALGQARSLIANLERLIVKKQAIKQGMMQQLLTGRTRLPGFPDDWQKLAVASKSVMKARIGWQGLKTDEYRDSGVHRLVGGTEFIDGRVAWNATPFVDKWRYDQDAYIQLRPGDVLLTKDGSIGKTAFVDSLPGPATLNSGVFVIRPIRNAYDPQFLFFMLRSRAFEEFLARLSAGSTISHLYQRDLVTLLLDVPPSVDEQRAIAEVLADAESDVAVLQSRLTKAQDIKTGMMQQLLTGRTRLPAEATA